ncbi:MAG: YceI family protein [Planctomycetes bacterium]|nr:YceI family protein [Planctomycetota bacterium]
MAGRLLQILGALTILGMCAALGAGFTVLKDRVRVVVQDDRPDSGPDPTALLRDDVQLLSEDVKQLQNAVAGNFQRLATGLDDGASARHEDVLALRREVAALAAALQRVQTQVAGVQQGLEQQRLAQQVTPPAEGAPAAGGEPQVQAPSIAPEVADPTPVEPVATTAPAKPKTTGFLSFQLPSSGFAFDQPQRYVLLPELCRVGFDAKSTLHDFTGVTSELHGEFRADWDDADGLCVGEVVVDARALKTGVEGRDENMLEHLDTPRHPELRFAVQAFRATAVDVPGRSAVGDVIGRMTIRGKTCDLRMPVRITVDPQQRVVIEGQAKLLLSDYEVPVPNQLGVISMEDQVVIWIALRARAQAESK